VIEKVLRETPVGKLESIEQVLKADSTARKAARKEVGQSVRPAGAEPAVAAARWQGE
jgi:hypothetical protein